MTYFHVIDFCTDSGAVSAVNQDYAINVHGLSVVLDGATALESNAMNVVDFVQNLATCLVQEWRSSGTFIPSLHQALRELSRGLPSNPYELPSASMIALAVEERKCFIYSIGDCQAYTEVGDRCVKISFSEDRLSRLDEIARQLLCSYLALGFSDCDALAMVKPILMSHRALANSPNGYKILTLDPASVQGIERLEIDESSVKNILLCSDGFDAGLSTYRCTTIADIFERRKKLTDVLDCLRTIEIEDKTLTKYPRFKVHDDATAVLLHCDYPRESNAK